MHVISDIVFVCTLIDNSYEPISMCMTVIIISLNWSFTTETNSVMNQSEFIPNTRNQHQAWGNACKQFFAQSTRV